jgi:hypothetical protein
MGIYTFIRMEEQQLMKTTGDAQINNLLKEVNSKMKFGFVISEREVTPRRRLFKKPKPYNVYTLYGCSGGEDVQVINFCQDHDWSVNTVVSKSYIVTYLLGILAGLDRKEPAIA